MNKRENLPFVVSAIIVLAGILVRIVVYFQNRSLIIDEANVARNIVEKGFLDFFQPLDYEQFVPPLFSVWTKISILLFGVNEYALKFLSLMGGIISLLLLWKIARLLIKEATARWYILLLFSFSILAIHYATELKQYATDAAICLLFLWFALVDKEKEFSKKLVFKWAIGGALAIWFSMPLVFILAAIGLAYLKNAYQQKQFEALKKWSLIIVCWLLSFGFYYYLILHTDIEKKPLQDFHNPYFFDFLPTDKAAFVQNVDLLISLFRSVTDKTFLSILWAVLTFCIGLYHLIKKQSFIAILFALPILLCLLASSLQLYSLIERLSLFMLPLFMIVIGIGISFIWSKSKPIVKLMLILPMLVSVVNKFGYQYFWERMTFEDSKSALYFMENNRTEEALIYVYHDAVPAFIFYNNLHEEAFNFSNYHLGTWDEIPSEICKKLLVGQQNTDFWFFTAHTYPNDKTESLLNELEKIAYPNQGFFGLRSAAYSFELKGEQR